MYIKQSLPLVSAIIPTRNRPEMLIRAVNSVVRQSYPNMEIIIVDDGSEYDVENQIRKEVGLHKCRVLRNVRKPGAAGARNTGFHESHGSFIGFLDDDDEWMPAKIERQIEAFQKGDHRIGIVFTQYIIVTPTTNIIRCRQLEGNMYADLCRDHIAGNTSNPLIKHHVLEEVGLFDEEFTAAQDTDLWIRIAKQYHFTTVNEPLLLIYHHNSERITENSRRQIYGIYKLLRKHWYEFPMKRKLKLVKRIISKAIIIIQESFFKIPLK